MIHVFCELRGEDDSTYGIAVLCNTIEEIHETIEILLEKFDAEKDSITVWVKEDEFFGKSKTFSEFKKIEV